ncbi:MAG: Lrp/AsnC family transcriptional regulator [Nanoarchaeota archaeon]|nr:Lrp/AsnC family transcriptional regulator [Nanoarchaeota archaeon]MBU1030371.1 Lrp/AsnC family transcriptional regulator [Nanoarchaeota archaeon]MBU1850288.1 Lrp/AsnC family transcriptional regulator [Nanoarchaeota archaeon]
MKLDETDKKILNVLIDDSRLSYRQIAKKILVSAATVMHRVKRLEKEKIIERYGAQIDYDLLGYDIHVLIDLRVAKGKLFEIEKKIAANNNVYAVYDNTGHFDATILAKFKNRRSMDEFLKKIQKFDFVERTETKLILNTIKEQGIKL